MKMLFVTYIILFFGSLAAVVYFFYKKRFGYWKKRGFVYAEPSIPYGNLQGLSKTKCIGEALNTVYKEFPQEPYVGCWFFFNPALMIRDPELIKSIFVRDFNHFVDRGIYVNETDDPISAHLFAIGGTKWRNMRVKMTPTFTSGKIKMMFPIMVECSKRFQEILNIHAERDEIVEMKEFSARFTTDIISLTAFGLETDSLHQPDSVFREYGKRVFDGGPIHFLRGFLSFFMPKVAEFFRARTTQPDVSEFFLKVFRDSMEYRENNNVRRNDFLDLLIQLKNKGKLDDVDAESTESGNSTKFTFFEAAAQAFGFFAAGFETSSTTMQFALYELAKNQDVQEKARQEILDILKKYNGEMTYECAMEMSYLGRVIDETLRLHPPVPFHQRVCNTEYKIPGTNLKIEKGVQVVMDVIGLQRDPKYFPNPDKFEPDRFLDEAKNERHHYSYLPFGEGPRNCIGMRFGLLQTRMGLLTLLANYKFDIADQTPVPMVYDPISFILSPKGGMHLRISKIHQ